MPGTQHVLRDETLEDEIELVGDLVVAATVSEGPLTQEQIDAALGLDGVDPEPLDRDDPEAADPEAADRATARTPARGRAGAAADRPAARRRL